MKLTNLTGGRMQFEEGPQFKIAFNSVWGRVVQKDELLNSITNTCCPCSTPENKSFSKIL